MKTYDQKLARLSSQLRERGVAESSVIPFAYPMFRSVGLRLIPPVFRSYLRNAIVSGLYFAATIAFVWTLLGDSMPKIVIASILSGIFYGVGMAWIIEKKRKRLALGTWESLESNPDKE